MGLTDKRLGPVEAPQTESDNAAQKLATTTDVVNKSASPETDSRILSLSECQCLEDLEQVARAKLPERARTYFESATETHSAFHSNRASWSTLRLRPRVLRDVSQVSMRCRIMGAQSSLPIFIAPAAAARLGHPDGELCLARGAARMDIPQCVCTYASVAPKDIMAEFRSDPHKRGGALFFQLYVPKEKKGAEGLMAQAKAWGYEALLLTVDTSVIGKRDDDDKLKARFAYEAGLPNSANSASSTMTEEEEEMPLPPLPGQEPGTLRGVHNPTLAWEDLAWIRKCWGSDRRIILKGIQTAEDALEATRHDIDGIYISNHGGRQLDYAPSPVEVLFEIRKTCPEVFDKLDVYVDGGIRRGTDAIKALCLGARAVGIGRGFMYALSAYGTDGVVKAISSKFSTCFKFPRNLGF